MPSGTGLEPIALSGYPFGGRKGVGMAMSACATEDPSAEDGSTPMEHVSEPWSVVIIDDHPIMCAALTATFSQHSDFEVVAQGGTAEEAMLAAATYMPDLLLVDLNMPGGGLNAVRTVSARFPAVRILVLTAVEDDFTLTEAFRSGASGFVVKGVSGDDLVGLARTIVRGDAEVPPALAQRLLKSGIDYRAATGADGGQVELTRRETEILELVATGKSNAEIALEIGLADSTVKNHVTNILQKLHVRNRVEAALVALARPDGRF